MKVMGNEEQKYTKEEEEDLNMKFLILLFKFEFYILWRWDI